MTHASPLAIAPRAPPTDSLAKAHADTAAAFAFNVERLASDFAVDPATVRSLLAFLEHRIVRDDEARAILLSGDVGAAHQLLSAAVCAWYRQSAALLTELLANRTPRAHQIRAQVLADAYDTIRARQAAEQAAGRPAAAVR